jgi:hypothetical protein
MLLQTTATAFAQDFMVNTETQAVTRNWNDGGKTYYYRLVGGNLQFKKEEDGPTWSLPPSLPYAGCLFKNIAADGNRIFALTTNDELWWATMVEDSAEWVVFLLDVGNDHPIVTTALLTVMGIYSVETGYYEFERRYYADLENWINAYKNYVEVRHKPWIWNRIDRPRKDNTNDNIQDIAVGNWAHTVVTYYVLDADSHNIYYIDEEPLMLEWELVRYSDTLGLTAESRIDADHSVICATTANKIHWVRFDFHQPDRLPTLNWTEIPYDPLFNDNDNHPGWHAIDNPARQCDAFRIDVGCASGTAWPTPPTPVGEIPGWEGFLGTNPVDPPWTYPVRFIIQNPEGRHFQYRLGHAKWMQSLPLITTLDGQMDFDFDVDGDGCAFEQKNYADPNQRLSPLRR